METTGEVVNSPVQEETLEAKQEQRWQMLEKYYEMTGGRSDSTIVNLWSIGDELGWDRNRTIATYDYLKNEGLVASKSLGGGSTITHQGVKAVEGRRETQELESVSGLEASSLRARLTATGKTLTPEAEELLRLAVEARPDKFEIARQTRALSNRGEDWKLALTEFASSAPTGAVVEAIKFGLGF